jgi:nucleotide-binding universal stress UspA family protein
MTGKRQNTYFRKLLVGYDGSPQSEKAVDGCAFSLAQCLDATILIFAVARPPEPAASVELEAVLDDAKEHFEQGFKKILEKASSHDLEVKTDMAVGHPAEQIIHRAEADGTDLIILGRPGRSMISRMMLGSVSERALRYAHCPVMVVH